jgi:hypothetical protein
MSQIILGSGGSTTQGGVSQAYRGWLNIWHYVLLAGHMSYGEGTLVQAR